MWAGEAARRATLRRSDTAVGGVGARRVGGAAVIAQPAVVTEVGGGPHPPRAAATITLLGQKGTLLQFRLNPLARPAIPLRVWRVFDQGMSGEYGISPVVRCRGNPGWCAG